MTEPREALVEVARQRQAMAARIRLPWWYLALVAVSWAMLMGGGFLQRDHQRVGVPQFPYIFVGGLIFLPLLLLYRRWSGLHLVERSTSYPALKRHAPLTVAVFVGSLIGEVALFLLGDGWNGSVWAGIVVAAVSGCLVAVQLCRVNIGIRQDIVAGTASDG